MSGALNNYGIFVIVAVIGVLIIFGNALTFLIDMKATDHGLEFLIFKLLRICTVKFENLEYVKIGQGGWLTLAAYNLKNRPLRQAFFLKLRRGWFAQKLLVTPPDADAFIDILKKHKIRIEG